MADIKNENVNPDKKGEEQGNNNPADEGKKEPGKVKTFFKKHATKIKSGLLVTGGIAAGILADRAGIKFGGRKKGGDDPGDSE